MNDELKKAVQKSQATVQAAYPKERGAFKALLLTNPNYFGNLEESVFKPALSICCNTHYEELACVGYHPQQEYLEGVVYIYQPSGYGTDICGPGTTEFVRFYLSFDNGASWHDQGITSFQAHNIPPGTEGGKRLEYAVQLPVDPARRLCFLNHLIRVRAILSWNNPPPADQPNWKPVWGNVREVTLQVEPRRFIFPPEIIEIGKVKLPPPLESLLDPETPLPLKPKALGLTELATLYQDKGVPVHRFAHKELAAFAAGDSTLSTEALTGLLPGVKFDPDFVDKLLPTGDGDITFEELKCIGLDPNAPNTLVGVIQLKKTSGYSGGPCTNGSLEYVTFWGDMDGNGSFETCFGTAQVRVYDLPAIPPEGVYYAVRLPVNLDEYRRACTEGPRIVRVRAILSWNTAINCATPNATPRWGNREETLIHISPIAGAPAGKIAILGGIPTQHIDDVSGLTTSGAVFATNNFAVGADRPFAGRVTVQGAPLPGHSYKVEVEPAGGGAATPVLTKLTLTRADGTTYVHQANPITLRFDYRPFNENINGVLAQWDSSGDDKWIVRLRVFDAIGNPVGLPDEHMIQLDNTRPEASITITSGSGDCGKFTVGTLLQGKFVARDLHFASYSLSVEPAINTAPVGVPSPNAGTVQTAVAPGDDWSLDTTDMRACGYVIRVIATDRAIVNSQSLGHQRVDSVGFCLEEAEEK
jgi:hypothetical protein